MEASNAKRGKYSLAFFLTLILLNANCSGFGVLVKSNSTFRCDGRHGECLIEDDLELEFLMNPYVSRILANPPQTGTGSTGKKDTPACGETQDVQYNCAGKSTSNKVGCSGTYCRYA